MEVWNRAGWRRVWVAFGCLALGAAVAIPVVVWIVQDLSTAANVAQVVSIPLAVASVLGGLFVWVNRSGPPTTEQTTITSTDVQSSRRRQPIRTALSSVRQWFYPTNGRGRVVGIMALTVIGALLGLVIADRVVGNQPGSDLLARVPEPLREDCSQTQPAEGIRASATLSCRDASGQEVVISLFDTESSMDEAYGEIIRRVGITRGSGDCTITAGAEHRYPGVGAPIGRVLCYQQDSNAFLVWTDDAARTVAGARRGDGNDAELSRFWASLVGIPSFPTPQEQELSDIADETGCRRAPAGSLDRFPGAVAAVTCEPGGSGANTVSFYRFTDLDALQRSYNTQVHNVHAPAGGPACADGEAPGFLTENSWNIRDVELGRLLCYSGQQGELVMEWTVEPLLLLGRAVGTDPKALGDWWTDESGPQSDVIIQAFNAQAQPPFPTSAEQELLDRLPGPSRIECMRLSEEQVSEDISGDPIAGIVCGTTGDGPDQVRYYKFPDFASMTASYEDEASPGPDCNSEPPDFTGEAEYSRNGTATGRLACATNDAGFPYLVWTHDQSNVLALAFKDEDPAPLLAWWHTQAGPL